MPCYAKLDGKTYDFPALQWYHDGVAYCLKNGILSNQADGYFGIGETVSRAALAEALWVMAGKPETEAECAFTDVPEDHAARTAITWAANAGIMTGYGNMVFGTQDAVTRQQMLTALWRFEQTQETPVEAATHDLTGFKDISSIRGYALDAFRWACGAGIVAGDGTGRLCPDDSLQREQLAVMLYRYGQLPKARSMA